MAIFATACQKEQMNLSEESSVCDIEVSRLVSFDLVGTKSLDVLENEVLAETPEEYIPQVQELFKGFLTGAQWQQRTYRFNYNTVNGRNEPAVLTGLVSFVCDGTGRINRNLRTVSLYHIMFNVNQATTEMQAAMPSLRALHHTLVVTPLLQGSGVDAGNNPILVAEPLVKARQAIDCELAAIEVLDELGCAVKLRTDYYTENMGVSNGAAVALATQYLLETKAESPVVEKIRLRGTFCGAGCYDFSGMITKALSMKNMDEYSDAVAAMVPYAAMGTIISANSVRGLGIYGLKDYFSPECVMGDFNDGVEYGGQAHLPYSIIEHFLNGDVQMNYMDYMMLSDAEMALFEEMAEVTDYSQTEMITLPSVFENVIDNYSYRKIFNKNLYVNKDLENGELDTEGNLFKALMKSVSKSDMVSLNWFPASPLRMTHSTDDDFLPFDTAYGLYEKLSNNGNNKNVSFKTLRDLNHGDTATRLLMLNIGILPHPCPVD